MQHRDSAGLKKNQHRNLRYVMLVKNDMVPIPIGYLLGLTNSYLVDLYTSTGKIMCRSSVLVSVPVLENLFKHFCLQSINPNSGTANNCIRIS
jgi:hypothetical protein